MEWKTYCEESYAKVIPYLRTAIIKSLVKKGIPVKKAVKLVGISTTAYERHVNDKKVNMILQDEELGDMIEGITSRLSSGEVVEATSFCILCSKSRKVFGLQPCT